MRALAGVVVPVLTHAAPTFVAVAANANSGSAASVSPAIPSGVAQNDYMLLVASTFTATGIDTPSGWTSLLHKDSSSGWLIDTYLFGKVAGSSESAPTVARTSGSGILDAQIVAYRGVSTSSPIDASPVITAVSSAGTFTQPNITTATGNAMVVYIGDNQGPPTSWGTPSGQTRRLATSAGAQEQFLGIADKVVASPGAVSGVSWASGSTTVAVIIAVALKPA